jgi:hypothetical protein
VRRRGRRRCNSREAVRTRGLAGALATPQYCTGPEAGKPARYAASSLSRVIFWSLNAHALPGETVEVLMDSRRSAGKLAADLAGVVWVAAVLFV